MSQKVKIRKQRRYPAKVISPIKDPTPPLRTISKTELEPNPTRSMDEAASLHSTRFYVVGDLKQVGLITLVMFALLFIAYFIMR